MAWILHHLDLVEHYGFQYAQHVMRRHSNLKKVSQLRMKATNVATVSRHQKSFILNFKASRLFGFMGTVSTSSKKVER